MKIHVLASGSEGNSTYIESENHKILFDLGMNTKYIVEKLREIEILPQDIDYVFISHVHNDHTSALRTFTNRFSPMICMTQSMFYELPDISGYEHIMIYEDEVILNDIKIETVKTSHDVTDSRGFIITDKETSVVLLTDTGYLNQKLYPKLKNKNIYLLESNHDIEALMNGPYPAWLKARVCSDYGHLSNKAAAYHLTKLIGKKTKKIVLMHLSHKNNTESLALTTLKETFDIHNIEFNDVCCAKQRERVPVKND